jgi:hypothetical protein
VLFFVSWCLSVESFLSFLLCFFVPDALSQGGLR